MYKQFFANKRFERVELFALLADRFGVKRALYPGSFVHVTPSFFFPTVVYVDMDKRCPAFFEDPAVLRMVRRRRRYPEEPSIVFHHTDYKSRFGERNRSFDLLISQWAGPVGQACCRYLRPGGLLVANDSHGDASLAALDRRYELVAVVDRGKRGCSLTDEDLAGYFTPASGTTLTRAGIERSGRGGRYVKRGAMYLFRRVH